MPSYLDSNCVPPTALMRQMSRHYIAPYHPSGHTQQNQHCQHTQPTAQVSSSRNATILLHVCRERRPPVGSRLQQCAYRLRIRCIASIPSCHPCVLFQSHRPQICPHETSPKHSSRQCLVVASFQRVQVTAVHLRPGAYRLQRDPPSFSFRSQFLAEFRPDTSHHSLRPLSARAADPLLEISPASCV
jgi:hypothetical protein